MKRAKKSNKISIIIYIISAVMLLFTIPATAGISREVFRNLNKNKGYSVEQLYWQFSEKNYGALNDQIQFNIAVGKKITDEDKDFYAFAACYESAVNCYMYVKNNDSIKAQEELAKFNENAGKISRKMIKNSLEEVKKTYGIA